jgi:hypothetical protein
MEKPVKRIEGNLDMRGEDILRLGGIPSLLAVLSGAIAYANEVELASNTTLDTSALNNSFALIGNSFSVTLPAAAENVGKLLSIRARNSATGLYTLQAQGGETINGVASRAIWAQEVAVLLATAQGWTKVGGKSRAMSLVLRCNQGGDTIIAPRRDTWIALPVVSKLVGPPALAGEGYFRALRPGSYTGSLLGTAYISGGNGNAEGVSLLFKNGGFTSESIAGPQMVANTSDRGVQFSAIGQIDLLAGDSISAGLYLYVGSAAFDWQNVGNNPKLTVTEQPDW